MLIPRFNLRRLLVVTTGAAVFCLILSLGLDGHIWAAGISLAAASLALTMAFHVVFFLASWLCAISWRQLQPPTSPFAAATTDRSETKPSSASLNHPV